MRIKRPSSLNCLIISFFFVITTERKTFNFSTNKKFSKSSKSSKSLSNHLDNSNFSSKESGRKRNVYETIGRIVLATRQPEIPWKRGKKKKKKGSLLHEPISLDTGQLFSLPRLWGPLPPSDNNSLTLPNNSKLLSSSSSREVHALCSKREKWIRAGFERMLGCLTRDLSRSTELCLISNVIGEILWSRRNRCS